MRTWLHLKQLSRWLVTYTRVNSINYNAKKLKKQKKTAMQGSFCKSATRSCTDQHHETTGRSGKHSGEDIKCVYIASFLEDEAAPNTFHLHEQARSPPRPTAPQQPARPPPPLSPTPRAPFAAQFCRGREGFEAHMAAPHFGPWQAFVDSQPFTALVELLSRLKSPS